MNSLHKRRAIQATIDAITKAKDDITIFTALDDTKTKAVGQAYSDVFATVQGMIAKYGEAEKATLEGYYDTALKTDEKHLNDFMAKKSFLKAIAASTDGGAGEDASKLKGGEGGK